MKAVFAARGRPRQQSRERFWTGQLLSLHCCVVHSIGWLHCTPASSHEGASNLIRDKQGQPNEFRARNLPKEQSGKGAVVEHPSAKVP